MSTSDSIILISLEVWARCVNLFRRLRKLSRKSSKNNNRRWKVRVRSITIREWKQAALFWQVKEDLRRTSRSIVAEPIQECQKPPQHLSTPRNLTNMQHRVSLCLIGGQDHDLFQKRLRRKVLKAQSEFLPSRTPASIIKVGT